MDIACPNCAATYRVPDALIDGASALRCAACGHVWVPTPPRVVAPPLAAFPPAPSPPPAAPPPELDPPPEPPPPPPEPDPPPPEEPVSEPSIPDEPTSAPFRPAATRSPPPLLPTQPDTTLTLTPTHVGPPELAPTRLPEVPRRRRPAVTALSLAWAASIILVIAIVLGLIVFQTQISEAWPPFARLTG